MSKGYWVSVYEEIMNPDGLAAYAELAGRAVMKHGGKFLVRGGECVAKEGLPANRTVIIEYESFEQVHVSTPGATGADRISS